MVNVNYHYRRLYEYKTLMLEILKLKMENFTDQYIFLGDICQYICMGPFSWLFIDAFEAVAEKQWSDSTSPLLKELFSLQN